MSDNQLAILGFIIFAVIMVGPMALAFYHESKPVTEAGHQVDAAYSAAALCRVDDGLFFLIIREGPNAGKPSSEWCPQ